MSALPAPIARVPIGTVTPSGDVMLHPEWMRYLTDAVRRQVIATADLAGDTATLVQGLGEMPVPQEHAPQQDDAPAPDAHVLPADDAPGDVAALREEIAALRERLDALEQK